MRLVSATGMFVLTSFAAGCATSSTRPDPDPLKVTLRSMGVEGRTYVNDLGDVASIHLHKVHPIGDDLLVEDVHGHLTYLDGATLSPRWDFYGLPQRFDEEPDFTPSAIVGLSDGRLFVLSRRNGTHEVEPSRIGLVASAAPVATDSTVYVPTFKTPAGNKTMYAVNIANGYRGWGWRTNSDVVADMAKGGPGAGDTIYFAEQEGVVYAFSAASAQERDPQPAWASNLAASIYKDLEVNGDDLGVVTDDGRLVLLDRITGSVRWEAYPDAGERAGSSAQFSERHVFYRVGGELRAFDRATGLRAWGVPQATRFIAERGQRMLLAGENDTVLSVDKRTGKVLKRVRMPGWTFPTRFRADSTVFAISDRGLIVAVEFGL